MKMRLSKLLVIVMFLNLAFSGFAHAEPVSASLYFDNVKLNLTTPLEQVDGKYYVYGKDLPAPFTYVEGDGEIVITRSSVELKISFGSSTVFINDRDRLVDNPVYRANNKNYISLELISAVYGTNLSVNQQSKRLDLTLIQTKQVSGQVTMPTSEVASQDMKVYVFSDVGRTETTLLQGQSSCSYTIDIPTNGSYKIGYEIYKNPSYLKGYYSANKTVSRKQDADVIDTSATDLQNFNMQIISAPYISGTIKVPDGVVMPDDGLDINISCSYASYSKNSDISVNIPQGQVEMPYILYFKDENVNLISSLSYYLNKNNEDLTEHGYYTSDGISSRLSENIAMQNNKAENIDFTLMKNKKITGEIKLPNNKTAFNDLAVTVSAWIDNYDYQNNNNLFDLQSLETETETENGTGAGAPSSGGPSGGGGGGSISFPTNLIPAGQNSGTYTVNIPDDSNIISYALEYYLDNSDEYYRHGYYNQNGTSSRHENRSSVFASDAPPTITLLDKHTISGTITKPLGFNIDFTINLFAYGETIGYVYQGTSNLLNFDSAHESIPYSISLPVDENQYKLGYNAYDEYGSGILQWGGFYNNGSIVKDLYLGSTLMVDRDISGISFTPVLNTAIQEELKIIRVLDSRGQAYSISNNIGSISEDIYSKEKFSVGLSNTSSTPINGTVFATLLDKNNNVLEMTSANVEMQTWSTTRVDMQFKAPPSDETRRLKIEVRDNSYTLLAAPFDILRYNQTDIPNAIALDGFNAEVINGITMFRLERIIEIIGGSCSYDANSQTMTVTRNNTEISFQTGDIYARSDNSDFHLGIAPRLHHSEFMVGLRSILNVFNLSVHGESNVWTFGISYECDVTGSNTLPNFRLGSPLTASVPNDTASITVDVAVSYGATWKLYSDKSCQNEITDKVMNLKLGKNTAYIEVIAADKSRTNIYQLVITRMAETITALALNTPTNLAQTSTTLTEVLFTATPTPDSNIDVDQIEWVVNGKKQNITGTSFSYFPTGAGEFVVTVKLADNAAVCDSKTITVAMAPDDCSLSSLSITPNGASVPIDLLLEFDTSLVYAVELSKTNSTIPTVHYTTTNPGASAVITNADTVSGATTIVVTSADQSASKTYTINWALPGDYEYSKDISNDGLMISGYNGTGGDLLLPCVSNGKRITGIQDYAFIYSYTITSVVIPNSIERIGLYAFVRCRNLVSVGIPASVREISPGAFAYNERLTTIEVAKPNAYYRGDDGVLFDKAKTKLIQYPCAKTDSTYNIPEGIKNIESNSFSGAYKLTSVIIPPSVKTIDSQAFSNCVTLQSVDLGSGVINIGDWAFAYCYNLNSIIIPDSVTTIGLEAFVDCYGLTSITIPKNVANIGISPFLYCNGLMEINVAPENAYFSSDNGVLFDMAKTKLIENPAGKSGEYTMPDSVTSIADNAFSSCDKLTSITISKNARDIGIEAFSNTSLTSVTIPEGVISIGDGAFANNANLSSVVLPKSLTSMGWGAFSYCRTLESIIIPNGVTCIRGWSFDGCTSLTSVVISNSVTSIEYGAFQNDNILTIYCNTGSYAEAYAKENSYPYLLAPICPSPASVQYKEDLKLADIPLAEGFAWAEPNAILNVPGGSYAVKYISTDRNFDSLTQSVTVAVTKANPTVTFPTPAAVTYSPTLKLSDIVLGTGFAWVSPTTTLSVPGGSYQAIYTPIDTINYNTLTENVAVTIHKAPQSAPLLSATKTSNSITINKIDGAQYALKIKGSNENVVYGSSNQFNYLSASTTYTAYIRLSANENYEVSPATSMDVTTDSVSEGGSNKGGGTITVTMPTPAPTQIPQPSTKPLPIDASDIPWAQEYIADVINRGIMKGYIAEDGSTSFKPSSTATRAEFATALFNYLGFEKDGDIAFGDTKDHWAKDYIAKMVKEGIITGYNTEVFDPDAPITREQIAVILDRALKPQATAAVSPYMDNSAIAKWATDSVYAVRAAGWMSGDDSGAFRPLDTATRAEIATVFFRLAMSMRNN